MPNGWENLVAELVNKYDIKTASHKVKNVCKAAAIYGKADGVLYASHPPGFKLDEYQHDVAQEDGSTKPAQVNEFKCALEASKGNRSGGSGAGIRLQKTKFMFLRPSPGLEAGAYLSR